MKSSETQPDSTRDKLLEAAETLFAANGYSGVSVRQITNAAGVHLAAVNYHFGGKRNLYEQVFRSRWIPRTLGFWEPIFEMEDLSDISAEALIRKVARAFIEPPLSMEERHRHGMLVIQEMLRPSQVMDILETEFFVPVMTRFNRLLSRASKGRLDEKSLMLSSLGIMAVVRHFSYDRRVISKIFGRPYEDGLSEELVEFITRFVMTGLIGQGVSEA